MITNKIPNLVIPYHVVNDINVPTDIQVDIIALTIFDTVTNLVELVRLDNKSSAYVALQFNDTWLARYPRPKQCA